MHHTEKSPSTSANFALAGLLAALLGGSVTAAPLQPEAEPPVLRLDTAPIATDIRHAVELDRSPALAPVETIKRELNISDQALSAGRLTAVRGTQTLAIDRTNLGRFVRPDTLIIDRARSSATEQIAPVSLQGDAASSAKTYRLGWEILSAGGTIEVWGRDSTGIGFDGTTGSFRGAFDVGLTRAGTSTDNTRLQPEVPVSVSAPGALRVDPNPLEIRRLGRWYPVEITVSSVPGGNFPVSLSASPGAPEDQIDIQVQRPLVRLTANPSHSIPGWGIGKATISVQVTGMSNAEGYDLLLQSSDGTLEPVTVTLDARGYGKTTLRSSRSTGARISVAKATVFEGRPLGISFEAPWMYLALAMLGGLFGAFLKKRGREYGLRAAGVGATTGVLMALLVSVGIDWIGAVYPDADLATGGEALVFVLGALGALIGVGILVPDSAAV